ncbi:MAG: DUF5765 domain-containing protein [Rickettsiales bacterium]|jgi:hypothetical protein|nr:DUF5765 domain-containing protein [Rickettsiales bacterium]
MCWSGEASTVLAAAGIATTLYAAWKKEPAPLWIALGYFSLMEVLQAYTYSVIDRCELPSNQIATLFGYLHITFQPFFINAVALYFVPDEVRRRIAPWVYGLCFAGAIFTLIQLYPFEWAGLCDPSRPLCAERLCSVSGEWHIAWEVPTNGIGNYFVHSGFRPMSDGFPGYLLTAFALPLLYGSWRVVTYHYFLGPWLAQQLTSNHNEWPAIWCLLSIGILMLVVKTPLRRWLHVKGWWLWPKIWKES